MLNNRIFAGPGETALRVCLDSETDIWRMLINEMKTGRILSRGNYCCVSSYVVVCISGHIFATTFTVYVKIAILENGPLQLEMKLNSHRVCV